MSELIAWAAGFYEGEGSISCTDRRVMEIHGKRRTPQLLLSIGQRDKEPLNKFREAVDCGFVRGPYVNRGATFVFTATGKAVPPIVDLLWPWLSARRRAQAAVAIGKWEARFDYNQAEAKS